jgi:hypothetical protein
LRHHSPRRSNIPALTSVTQDDMMLLSLARAIPRGRRRRPQRTTMSAVGGGGGGGDGRVGHGERDDDRSSSSLLRILAFVAVDGDVSLSLLRRGPGQAREWQSDMRRRHKRWWRRWMGGVSVTRGEWRRDDATTSRTTDERHKSGRWRLKQQQLQLRNNQQKRKAAKTRLSSQREVAA